MVSATADPLSIPGSLWPVFPEGNFASPLRAISSTCFANAGYDRNQVKPVLALAIQVAAYLMQLMDGRRDRLSGIGALVAWEAGYEHRISSLVRTGYRFQASRNASLT